MCVSATTFVNFQHNVAKDKHRSSEIRTTALLFKVFNFDFFFIENLKNTKTPRYQAASFHLYKDPQAWFSFEKSDIRNRLNSGKTKVSAQ